MPYKDREKKALSVVWFNMIERGLNRQSRAYKDYGKRGITVCESWQGPQGFENFLADMGPRPGPEYTLERRKNDLGYFKENCVWATRKEQANNRRSNRLVTHKGQTKTARQWAEELFPENPERVQHRLAIGWSVDRALTTAIREKNVSRQNEKLTYNGESLSIREWTERLFPDQPKTILSRLSAGWSVEKTLSKPAQRRPRR